MPSEGQRPPFLKRWMGYGTVGGLLGCLTVIVLVLAVVVLLLDVGSNVGPG